MHIDEAGQDCGIPQIDDSGCWTDCRFVFRKGLYLVCRNNDHGMVDHAAGCRIEKAPGADYDNLRRGLCCCRKAGRVKDGGYDKNQSALQDASGRICGCSTERTPSDARKYRSRHCDRNQRTDLKTISNSTESTSSGKITPCLDTVKTFCMLFVYNFERL